MVSIQVPEACLVLGEVPVEVDGVAAPLQDVGAGIALLLAVDGEGAAGPQGLDQVDAVVGEQARVEPLRAVCSEQRAQWTVHGQCMDSARQCSHCLLSRALKSRLLPPPPPPSPPPPRILNLFQLFLFGFMSNGRQ